MPSALPHALTRVTVQIAKLCHIYIISNFEDEFVGWEDWDFDLEFYEFCEALARHGTGPSIPICRRTHGFVCSDRTGSAFAQICSAAILASRRSAVRLR